MYVFDFQYSPRLIMSRTIKIGILTVSDSCSQGKKDDTSGPNLKTLIENKKIWEEVSIFRDIVADDVPTIKETLVQWADEKGLDVIFTTGGTGFSLRDVTPEATKLVIDREAPGMILAMLKGSLNVTPLAMLSRPVCGMRGSTLIINFPGSKKASEECLGFVSPGLKHAVDLLRGHQQEVSHTHTELQGQGGVTSQAGRHRGHHQGHSCPHSHEDIHPGEHHNKECHSSDVDISKVARRPRASPYPLISVEQAVKCVMAEADSCQVETVNYTEALHRILAEDVYAQDALPPFPASIKDGYAVIASDGDGVRKVLGDSVAGGQPRSEVIHGYCVRISTGAPVPKGADAVVQVEDTELVKDADGGREELEVRITSKPTVGQDIRPLGSDIASGEKVLGKGQELGPPELGLLATVGVTEVQCVKMPVVGVMSTGNENGMKSSLLQIGKLYFPLFSEIELKLVEPGQPLGPGQIRDANRTTLMYTVREQGFPVVDLGIAPDTQESLIKHLKDGLSKVDVIVSSGGVSMGEKDLMKDILLVDFKAKLHFARVFMKPGKPTTFATVTQNVPCKKLLFCLPGNPVSATVTCNLYVLPALRKMAGQGQPHRPVIKARISHTVKLDPRPEYHRCLLSWQPDNPIPLAESTGNQISSRLLSMKSATALMILPSKSAEKTEITQGGLVDCMLLR